MNYTPYGYNPPNVFAQQRLTQLENQYPQYSQGYPQTPSPNSYMGTQLPVVKGRPVSNEEEANAAMIDFDGSLFVFPDKAHNKIYTKQLGLDGNIVFCKYSLDSPTPVESPRVDKKSQDIDLSKYATREELSRGLEGIKSYLSQQLDQLTNPTGGKV